MEKKIWWVKGDCFDVMKKQYKTLGKQAVIFGSPPWGGPGYREDDVFKLATMQPYGLRKLYDDCSKITKDIVLYLPRTSDLNEIADLAEEEKQIPVTHYCMKGASKVRWYHSSVLQIATENYRQYAHTLAISISSLLSHDELIRRAQAPHAYLYCHDCRPQYHCVSHSHR